MKNINELDDCDYIEEVYDKIKQRKLLRDEKQEKEILNNKDKDVSNIKSIDYISTREWIKDIYIPDDNINDMTLDECIELKKRLCIETLGIRIPKPIGSFLHLIKCIPIKLINRLGKLGYIQPTSIQCQAIPCILQGRNTIIISETGSGKTLSYILPIIAHVLNLIKQWSTVANKKCVYCIILTLNRELCYQIYYLLYKLCKGINIRILCLSTGIDKTIQYKSILQGCEIAVCNPIRLLDLISLNGIKLYQCNYFIVDECDKLLTSEYEHQTINILSQLRDDVINVLVSATTTDQLYKKMKSLVRNSITIKVGTTIVGENGDFYNSGDKKQVIIFCNNKNIVGDLYKFIANMNNEDMKVCVLHGDLIPKQRFEILEKFKNNHYNILITTDLLCRGIDIPNVNCIINYDAPKHYHTLLHRIGRCTRYNNKGTSYTMLTKSDNKLAAYIAYNLNENSIEVPKDVNKLAYTFLPFKKAKASNINFLQFLNTREVFSKKQKVVFAGGRKVGLDKGKSLAEEVEEHTGVDVEVEGKAGGREYNIDDEITSSSDDDMEI